MKKKLSLSMLGMVLTFILSSLPLTGCHHEDDPEISSGRDELSNTSWELVSISGWEAESSKDWRGDILTFGADGQVTEKFFEGGSESGTYELINGKIRFKGISQWTNRWGSTFSYNLSEKTLNLKDDLGSIGSTFHFTKQ